MNWSERLILSDGLDAIRDSRIASQGWLSGPFLITFDIRGSQPVRFREDCERGANGIIYRKARGGVEITDLETNTARVGTRSSCATRLCANRNQKGHSCLARPYEFVGGCCYT